MARIAAPKGCEDVLPDRVWRWHAVEAAARTSARLFHFREIRTPVFEHTELFKRGAGETTDIVRKETFTFDDRGGESMTLRPEGTAGVVRAMIEHNLLADPGARQKVYYIGPNFRYERPQKGRLRIHHQFGAEAFGVASPEQDVECILLQLDFYRRCGLRDLSLRINSLGDRESKTRYRDRLVAFLSPRADQLSEDSQRRLTENPLRILDSKDPRDVSALTGAPSAIEALSDRSRDHFQAVQRRLTEVGVPFTVDGTLVRGFDYYTDTLWEFTAGGLGAQSAVGGGGRYDNLVETLGGKPCPGVGFGAGIERLLIALEAQGVALPTPPPLDVLLVAQSDAARPHLLPLAHELRSAGIATDLDLAGRSFKAQLKLADRENPRLVLFLGDAELAAGTVVVKDSATRQQTAVPRSELVAHLQSRLAPPAT
ncbi:MAG: histidine--tRNA ligase [Tepidisphaerales bacterium]